MDRLRFVLNDTPVELSNVAPTTTLLRYLRDDAQLCGTKEGCAEGDCGACTVAFVDRTVDGKPTYRAVNSCLVLLPMLQGRRIYTVEGIGNAASPHPVQAVMAEKLGSQCGYCTPGFVMALFEAAYRQDLDEPWKLDAQLCGNLCRCTGYRPIRDAGNVLCEARLDDRFAKLLRAPGGEPNAVRAQPVRYQAGAQRAFNPRSFEELWDVLGQHPEARIIAGGTDLSLEVTKRFAEFPTVVSPEAIDELHALDHQAGVTRIGALVTLTDLEDHARARLVPLERILRYFGARAIKNRGTVGGNLCNASPIGDLAPVLLSLEASVVLRSRAGERTLPLDQFFLGYRKTALAQGEVLVRIDVPDLAADAFASAYKVSKRRELDISAVAAGMFVRTDAAGIVRTARLGFGGMAAIPARARKTEAALVGQPWTEGTVRAAAERLADDFQPLSDHRGSARYRALVAKNLLIGFFAETSGGSRVPRLPTPHTATVEVR